MLHSIFYKNDSWGFWWNLKLTAIYAIAHFVDGNLNWWLAESRGIFLTKMHISATDWEKTLEKYRLLFYNQNFRPCRPLFLATKMSNGGKLSNNVLYGIQEEDN